MADISYMSIKTNWAGIEPTMFAMEKFVMSNTIVCDSQHVML
jgi:hypothetical protein